MPDRLRNRRRHQRVFVLAGMYNVAWGVLAVTHPQWLWQVAGMPVANYPQIFATLGMVIGLYGVVYFEIARRPEDGFVLAAVGLLGKVLGPIGLGYLIVSGQWPPATVVICLTNDLIWWVPFSRYLKDAWPRFAASLRHGPPIPTPRAIALKETHVV